MYVFPRQTQSYNKNQGQHIMMSADVGPDLQDAWTPPDVRILYHTDTGTASPLYSAETYVSAYTKCQ